MACGAPSRPPDRPPRLGRSSVAHGGGARHAVIGDRNPGLPSPVPDAVAARSETKSVEKLDRIMVAAGIVRAPRKLLWCRVFGAGTDFYVDPSTARIRPAGSCSHVQPGIVCPSRKSRRYRPVPSSPAGDHLYRGFIRALNMRLVVALCPELCREAAQRHKASPAATCAPSRGMLAGCSWRRSARPKSASPSSSSRTVRCAASASTLMATAWCAAFPMRRAPARVSMAKRQRLAPLLGRNGVVHVVRDIGVRDRYQGQVSFVTAEVDEDVEAYLRDSEQIPSALGCEVTMDAGGAVLSAGGVLVQSMPDSPEETKHHLREVQHMLRSGELYDLLKKSPRSAEELARLVAGKYADSLELFDERPLRFQCRCDRERIKAMIGGLELTDLDEMISEGKAEISCNYCAQVYSLDREELISLRQARPRREQN